MAVQLTHLHDLQCRTRLNGYNLYYLYIMHWYHSTIANTYFVHMYIG